MSRYLLDNARREAGERFNAMGELFDRWTMAHLARVGLVAGWRCWEVGAGGASIPRALAARVGSTGRVLATDIDTSWIASAPGIALDVRVHDVADDPPPNGTFDLVHARLVLVHLADRARALESMVSALRPGGWLVIEDADPQLQPLACPDQHDAAAELANRLRAATRQLMADRGADMSYGRTVPRRMRAAGLGDVYAEAFFPLTAPVCGTLEAATTRHLRADLLAAGLATDDEIDAHLDNLASGAVEVTTAPLVTTWGRKPPSE